ncbi:MAG: GNAT family N-acetyltransferase [Candidatus Krumholzibacteriota bacterium]|nr:GNAT family N-acetyltransferase [Candidatus Krumholzibacteriota bacterium]
MELSFNPLTPERWNDFTALFGERGACGGCWCMLWRLPPKQFRAGKGEGNRLAMKALVDAGEVPGILAFDGDRPVGWCAISPRESYCALERSRILSPVDDRPCWSVTCFFIEKSYRKKGVSTELLKAAIEYARSRGAKIVEGYPVEPSSGKEIPPAFAWTGIPAAFIRAGFTEVARRSPARPVMRVEIDRKDRST